jgi:hypothetical protein
MPITSPSPRGGAARAALLGLGYVLALPVVGLATLAVAGVRAAVRGALRLASHAPRRHRPAHAPR